MQHVRSVRSLPQNSLPEARPAANPQVQTVSSKVPAAYQLLQENHYLDFGRGHPEDILRENEFAFSLVLLYFSNFNDIHFMFDEEAFLRDFRMGDVPPIILYSMMALSIRYSRSFPQDRYCLMPKYMGENAWLKILLAFPLLHLGKNYTLAIAENLCGGMREISSRILLTGHRLLLSKSTSY